jgi:SAM-dependent methyltransferase
MPRTKPKPAAYDAFAWFYSRYWNEEFHGLAFPILERIWLPRVPVRGRILDLCCGTGYLAAMLAERGYTVTGVDASEEMIRHARLQAPKADFHVADASHFNLPPLHDAAVSTFDSLNHLLSARDLAGAFRNTAAALKPGSPFAFDMLLEAAYQTHWGETFALVRDDHTLTITGAGYDFRSRIAQCRVTMFRCFDGAWQRVDTVVEERCYTPAEIDAALAAAGFGRTTCYDARDLGMAGELGIGRTFFVTTRL